MPYTATRRLYHIFGRKVSKFLVCRKAKKLYNEINRDISFVESRYLKSRLHQA